MKKTFIAFLVLAGWGYAAPLNKEDWTYVGEEAPDGVFVFNEDGTLDMTSNTNGKKLGYVIDGSNPMVNGSGLSITFQFNTEKYLNDDRAEFAIYLYETDVEFHRLSVINLDSNANIYESITDYPYGGHDVTYTLNDGGTTTSITVNYTVRGDYLCYNYLINDIKKVNEDVIVYKTLDTTLNWRPVIGISGVDSNEMVFTVTDVTFKSVPEPTTAVLSLLALAGLAARRRR